MKPHTQYPDTKFVRPGTPYPKDRLGIQVNDSSLSIHPTSCIDNFIDRLVEEDETVLPERDPVISTSMLLQLEYELNAFQSWNFLDLMGTHVNGQTLYKTLRIECMIKEVLQMIFAWKGF